MSERVFRTGRIWEVFRGLVKQILQKEFSWFLAKKIEICEKNVSKKRKNGLIEGFEPFACRLPNRG